LVALPQYLRAGYMIWKERMVCHGKVFEDIVKTVIDVSSFVGLLTCIADDWPVDIKPWASFKSSNRFKDRRTSIPDPVVGTQGTKCAKSWCSPLIFPSKATIT
jgi:hypothetical protein